MKFKRVAIIILAIVDVIACMIINFPEFAMGSSVTVRNLIVTLTYMAIWIFVLRIGIKSREYRAIKYFSVFWSSTLFFSMLVAYINFTDVYMGWPLPFVILLITQWHGIDFFIKSNLMIAIVIAFISFIILTISAVYLRHGKRE